MTPFTIEEKIKILFQADMRNRDILLEEYATCDSARKADIVQVITDQYASLYDGLAVLKYDELMNEVSEGIRTISNDLLQQAYAAVHEDLRDVLTGKVKDDQEIRNIQQKIQSLSVASQ